LCASDDGLRNRLKHDTMCHLFHGSSEQQYWSTIPEAVCTAMCFWWWAEEPPETCRASVKIKNKKRYILLAVTGKYNTMHGHMNKKKKNLGIYRLVMYVHIFVCLSVILSYPVSDCILSATTHLSVLENWVKGYEPDSCGSRRSLVADSCGHADETLVCHIWGEEAILPQANISNLHTWRI
jgi:hypothetical protein